MCMTKNPAPGQENVIKKEFVLGEPVARQQILEQLKGNPAMYRDFEQLSPALQEDFLDFCSGAAGLKICYDPFFKYMFNPDIHPDRLSDLLSAILNIKVKVKKVLVHEGGRMAAEGSLVIMDIVVELEDGSIANVEIQKVPYFFPGQRAACYSSDLVLRQYSKAKRKTRGKRAYKKLKSVYTIVLLEKSGTEFHQFEDVYIHRAEQRFDSGLSIDLLQKYIYIPLDVFRKIHHNKHIETELEAWIGFLAYDDPEHIWEIQSRFPRFRELYADMAEFRNDVQEVLNMFSKALAIMDRDTVDYMMEEWQREIDECRRYRAEQDKIMEAQKRESEKKVKELEAELAALKARLGESEATA